MDRKDKKELPHYMWSVVTGRISLLNKASRQAVAFMTKCEGFCAIQMPDEWHTIFLYDSLNNAKGARNRAEANGIKCGKNICRFRWEPNESGGMIVFDDTEFEKKQEE